LGFQIAFLSLVVIVFFSNPLYSIYIFPTWFALRYLST